MVVFDEEYLLDDSLEVYSAQIWRKLIIDVIEKSLFSSQE